MSVKINHELVGQTVSVRKVGDKQAFIGIVAEAWFWKVKDKPSVTYFNVIDPTDGTMWNRDEDEIRVIENIAEAA
ncbi:hypothetical protein [Brucella sp. NBRC 12950]|uniref:hypothetical protein n=1 Tax=Brucella sp. NBRC 12950 TaxID=2994518 RepID=UPI0024A3CBFD|nr:hypothetical protein [Brucella sp. NBRC 12950]GLU26648.1 hypothetical protein Brsp01_18810 [Brucella sp. NBRC 12950]